ncbi:MAG TPA: 16S rRNA (guanine(527)-N(7))-methyltransferase RsmG [Vicinamibacterales bacterium]
MPPRDFRSRLARRASKLNVFLQDEAARKLTEYYELLTRWNRKINLTSITDADEAIDRLLLEPIIAARHFPTGARQLMDIGSGGGSPAIPFKILNPSLRLTMVEAKARKSAFLREAVRQLSLAQAAVENTRFEELLARPDLHETQDVVSLRAVRTETRVLTSLQAFVSPGGVILLFRGPAGPETPAVVVPPLEWTGTFPLVDSLRSRVTVLAKRQIR